MSNLTKLVGLDCSDNSLSALDVSNLTELFGLTCDFNENLTTVYAYNCPDLPDYNIYIDEHTTLVRSAYIKLTGVANASVYVGVYWSGEGEVTAGGAPVANDDENPQSFSLDANGELSFLFPEGITEVKFSSLNSLSALDVRNCPELTWLGCETNNLSSLDVSNLTKLTELFCSGNDLSSLDVSNLTELTTLWCSENKLSSLDVSNLTKLTTLWCDDNSNLTTVYAYNCPALEDAKIYKDDHTAIVRTPNSVGAVQSAEPAVVVGYSNAMGQRLQQAPERGFYIEVYDNGKGVKRIAK